MIRFATPDDLPQMATAEKQARTGSQWTLNQLKEELSNPRATVLIAEKEEGYAGHGVAWFVSDEVEIMTVTVLPPFRRQGIGRVLLSSLLNSRPWSVALLELRESNYPARALYERNGFREVGQRKAYYRDGENAVLMRREKQKKPSRQ